MSMLQTPEKVREGWRRTLAFASCLVMLIASYGAWFVWMTLPGRA